MDGFTYGLRANYLKNLADYERALDETEAREQRLARENASLREELAQAKRKQDISSATISGLRAQAISIREALESVSPEHPLLKLTGFIFAKVRRPQCFYHLKFAEAFDASLKRAGYENPESHREAMIENRRAA